MRPGDRRVPDGDQPPPAVIVRMQRVRVVKRFGDKGAVDLAGLIGYYSFVSVTLNVFEVPTPPGAKLLGK